jgi:hypothetical protein
MDSAITKDAKERERERMGRYSNLNGTKGIQLETEGVGGYTETVDDDFSGDGAREDWLGLDCWPNKLLRGGRFRKAGELDLSRWRIVDGLE